MRRTNRRDFMKTSLGAVAMSQVAPETIFAASGIPSGTVRGRQVLETFDYRGVALEDGPLLRLFDQVRDDYLRVPNDDLLKGFRQRAGLAAPGIDLGGWYTRDFFNIFGQLLSGLSRMYAATGDPDCREKLDALIEGWSKTIAQDGFFYYTIHPNAPHYTYEKMLGGLVDASVYGGNAQALPLLDRITDWAIKNLSQDRVFSFNAGQGNTEWYTLSENLYRAYLITGDPKYRNFAEIWEYTEFWNLFAQKQDIFSPFGSNQDFAAYHAYSHVNSLNGAGPAYLVKGDARYLQILRNAYDYLTTNQTYATGGFGPGERLMPPEALPQTLFRLPFQFETQCGSWAIFKLTKYLLMLTGDAKYGDWTELAVINGIGASVPMAPDGRVFYFSNYNIENASKTNFPEGWTCCNGTRTMDVADFHDLIYFKDPKGVYVNLFTPSTARWRHKGAEVTLAQHTRFPEEDEVEFVLTTTAPCSFALNFRAPSWLAFPMTISVNGKPVNVDVNDRHWASVEREWHDRDRVTLTLPASFRLSRLPGAGRFPAALMRGPVALAFRAYGGTPPPRLDFDHLDASFVASPGEALTYHLNSDASVLARPFYAFKEGEPYHLYLHPDLEKWVAKWKCILSNNDWYPAHWYWFSARVDATAQREFEGTGIRWTGYRFEDGGKAEVSIDGKPVAVVDQYGPAQLPATPPIGQSLRFKWEVKNLPPGKHTLMIKVLFENNDASKGRRVTISTLEEV